MRLSRADRSAVSEWWYSVDRELLSAILALMLLGFMVSLAASPTAARRFGEHDMFFVQRHALFLAPAVLALFGASLLSRDTVLRLGAVLFFGGLILIVAALLQGHEKNGAVRWLDLGPLSLQPSEFVKPGLVLLVAAVLSRPRHALPAPALTVAGSLLAVTLAAFLVQPDFGQSVLVALVWGALLFIAGYPLATMAVGAGIAAAGAVAAYHLLPHVARRIDRFIDPAAGDTRQVDLALEAFRSGGWFGKGPGEGTIKLILPDSHTDYVFAVIAEEFGLILCFALLGLTGFILLRLLRVAARLSDGFSRAGTAGLALLFGTQAFINMAVNVGLLPSKGMTLPFVSYGGSSMIASALTLGLALSLSRRRPMPVTQAVEASGTSGLWTLRL